MERGSRYARLKDAPNAVGGGSGLLPCCPHVVCWVRPSHLQYGAPRKGKHGKFVGLGGDSSASINVGSGKKIGRASCRERVEIGVVAGAGEETRDERRGQAA